MLNYYKYINIIRLQTNAISQILQLQSQIIDYLNVNRG